MRHPQHITKIVQEICLTKNSCAAKHKSRKALRDDCALFDQLAAVGVYATDELMTTLVLQLQGHTLEVQSDRPGLHHAVFNDELRVYIPDNPRQQRACRRSQLPGMLAIITGCNPAAKDDISAILSCPIEDLDDIMLERDITDVPWIERPVLDLAELQEDERSDTLSDNDDLHRNVLPDERATHDVSIVQSSSAIQRRVSVASSRTSHDHVLVESESEEDITAWTEQYCKLLDQLIACAHGRDITADHIFRSTTTFGHPGVDNFEYNRQIGAAGEAYVRYSHAARIPDCRLTLSIGLRATFHIRPPELLAPKLAKHNSRDSRRSPTIHRFT